MGGDGEGDCCGEDGGGVKVGRWCFEGVRGLVEESEFYAWVAWQRWPLR